MKKVKYVPILASICLAVPTASMVAYADNLDKDTIVSELWSEWWVGQGDDGRSFPEASYKHHILEEWVDTNYGSDDYEWSDTGELQYSFKIYYKNMIENWDFNDDDNGNWTIDTDTTTYHFSLDNGKWLMIDSNGDIADTFMPFSTLEEKAVETPKDQNNSSHRVKGGLPQETAVASGGAVSQTTTESVAESHTEPAESTSNGLLYTIGGLILAGLGTIGVMLYRRKK